ncbi:ABC transporter permease subunit [Octadecabacter sp. 1_MG-2023]|uniref:ABC transporter permease n=1 Tax=unclassified Octadecabacter TaxID=196158 RepID=UPI001C080AEC|nr:MULTISPECIES: ABC transporter permease subunit [unclassified Octadecabacter]MBU2993155.1 ABC transporter permease subunit [Octadecabacter sp. B2R22]MDO6733393.1 ABC transporter permease subunit [Octadecabacter sp. 1_MG-2023]
MAFYDKLFETLGLSNWCGEAGSGAPLSMADLMAQASGDAASGPFFPFPSLDNLNESCSAILQSRDVTKGIEDGFLAAKPALKSVLDPLTQPLSWMLDGALWLFEATPWFIMIPVLVGISWYASRSKPVTIFVFVAIMLLGLVDHYDVAMQTLSIIFVCTTISVLLGVPIGIAMSKSDRLQKFTVPVLDLLQTLPTFVYLIPLIFLFSVTESKLYGIAIILYAIVPVIRLTDLGIRLVDQDVIEAADAFGMNSKQKLLRVQLPLALPNIMAGVNQTIMMSLAMVVIASLVSAPGLGVNVLRGIRNLELGVGIVAGIGIVLLAVILDRVSKAALSRVDMTHVKH